MIKKLIPNCEACEENSKYRFVPTIPPRNQEYLVRLTGHGLGVWHRPEVIKVLKETPLPHYRNFQAENTSVDFEIVPANYTVFLGFEHVFRPGPNCG